MNKPELYAQFLGIAFASMMKKEDKQFSYHHEVLPDDVLWSADAIARKMVEYVEGYAAEQGE